MGEYTIRPLGPDTWDDFENLAGRHNGVWNGCWCTWFHTLYADKDKDRTAQTNRALKERRVREGMAHAALVFDGDLAVAWCQYGTPEELPNIYHRKEYEAGLDRLPKYRITCFFVDKKYRRQGLDRHKGKNHCVMSKEVPASAGASGRAGPRPRSSPAGRGPASRVSGVSRSQ